MVNKYNCKASDVNLACEVVDDIVNKQIKL